MPWLIGDVHGCFHTFEALLKKIEISRDDHIVIAGDLINRGSLGLEVLDKIIENPTKFSSLMGNHDLGYLAWKEGLIKHGPYDNFSRILEFDNELKYSNFIRQLPFMIVGSSFVFAHAGIYPFLSINENYKLAEKLGLKFKEGITSTLFSEIFNKKILHPDDINSDADELAFAINIFTRMRFVSSNGRLILNAKGKMSHDPDHRPWFEYIPPIKDKKIYFGHWAALVGATNRSDIICLDTGCVWGKRLTGIHSDEGILISVDVLDELPNE